MDIQIEQQKLSNLLLQNIAELLRIPDSEKERQHSIELGIKFFVNAKKDSDLFSDALEELLKAESLMRQDYFVLHRIGCIYLYAKKYINPEKALDYFLRAAKYASVESDTNAVRLSNALTNKFNTVNTEINNSEKLIGLLAADSYEKASFSAYVLGRFDDAVTYQTKALKFNSTPQNRFLLAKYQLRNGNKVKAIANLNQCIDEQPYFAVAIFKEIDFVNETEVINLIAAKNENIDQMINQIKERFMSVESTNAVMIINELHELSQKSYEIKKDGLDKFENKINAINASISKLEVKIDTFIKRIKRTIFLTYDLNKISLIINELDNAKNLPLEKMQTTFDKLQKEVQNDKIKIGSKYGGGIVFYLDKTGTHGLVCADKDFGQAVWGGNGEIGADGEGIADGTGMENTKKITAFASWYINRGFFSSTKKPAPTAARLCLESNYNGYSDWYLPTESEIDLICENLHDVGIGAIEGDRYWSSTEQSDIHAYYCDFNDEGFFGNRPSKIDALWVRAVRAF
jgi:tetratricopeptide (TPR) repeat protein